MRSLLGFFRRDTAPTCAPVEELRTGINAALTAAGWHRVTEPESGHDRRLLHAWPGLDLWAPDTGDARVALDAIADHLQSWRPDGSLAWLQPNASAMPVLQAIAALRHNRVIT